MAIDTHAEKQAFQYCRMSFVFDRARDAIAREALAIYGDHGSLISGCVRDHFPLGVKDTLRNLAYTATNYRYQSQAAWRASGRRASTFIRDVYEVERARQR